MNYDELEFCLKTFTNLKIETIGRSWDNRNIYSISTFFSNKNDWVLMHGGIHAREHLSTDLCITLAKIIDKNYTYFENLKGFPNICIVPMVNPDGVQIAHFGENAICDERLKKIVKDLLHGNDYKLIKSNSRGVDLNNNFGALFEKHIGSTKPSINGYKGEFAFSEKETIALRDITLKIKPIFTISYHLKGEEIYFDFYQNEKNYKRDEKIAKLISEVTGYTIRSTQHISFGGYKDWCVSTLKIPSITIELGRDELEHPIKNIEIYDIIAKNIGLLSILCDIVKICKE